MKGKLVIKKFAPKIFGGFFMWEVVLKKKSKVNMNVLRESVDEVLNKYDNPTHIRVASFHDRVFPIYIAKMRQMGSRARKVKSLKSILGRILQTKGWVKSQFMESKSDFLLDTPVKISDYWYTKYGD